MRDLVTRGRVVVLAITLALSAAAPVTAGAVNPAAAFSPKVGVYHGIVDKTPYAQTKYARHNEGEGYVRLKKTSKGFRIVRPGSFSWAPCGGPPCFVDNATAPGWWGKPYNTCGNERNAAYAKNTKIPVTKTGAGNWHFDYTARSALDPTRRIRFVGTWKAKGKIRGYTQFLVDGGCKSDKLPWTITWIAN